MYQRDNIKPLFEKKGKNATQAVDDFIQSLNQPKEIEIEMYNGNTNDHTLYSGMITIKKGRK